LGAVSPTTSFGAWLRQRRRTLGLSHAALADAVSCSVSALRKIEQDERRPSFGLAERLATHLQVAATERARFLEIARGEKRVELLDDVVPVPPTPLPPTDTAPAATPLRRLFAPFDATVPSIAVLPFTNLSDDAANEHFADGLAEELLTVLGKIPGLRVASRTSAFSFKGKAVDVPTIAQKLNVSTILAGSVRKAGQRVRITAQLIEVMTDSHLWSHTYDRDLEDIFAVQDDIARSVVKELRAALLGETAEAAAEARAQADVVEASRGRTANPQAQQLYLRGRFLIDLNTPEDTKTGIACCQHALELDPGYALAWAGLSRAYSNQAGWGWAPLTEAFHLSRNAARRALELEPDLPEAHAEIGWTRMTFDWDWRGAEDSYRRAVARGSGNRAILVGASVLADNLGRNADAVALARRAVEVDPLCFIAQGNLALRCLNAGLPDEAATAAAAALTVNTRGALMHWLLGTILLAQKRPQEALDAFEHEEVEVLRIQGRVLVLHDLGQEQEARAALDKLIEVGADDGAFQIAEAVAYLGDIDNAFAWLERARVQRDPGVSQLQSGPLLRNLHPDPRWRPFLEKMGFTAFPDAPTAAR
jgi:TolB-like protein/DNA-binding XRE family transcriptional regulator